MQCPKCGFEQPTAPLCASCGLVIAKFKQRQTAAAKSQESPPAERPTTKSAAGKGMLWLGLAVALLVGLGAGKLFFSTTGSQEPVPSPSVAQRPVENEQAEARILRPKLPPATERPAAVVEQTTLSETAARPTVSRQEKMMRARNATVYIETPWGSGSGFLVDGRGHLVTNRHVVEFDPEQLREIKKKIDELDAALKDEKKNLDYYRSELPRVADPALRERYRKQLDRQQENFDKYSKIRDDLLIQRRKILEYSVQYDVKVILFDGSEFGVVDYSLSDRHDLALLTLDRMPPASVVPARFSEVQLQQGHPVYAIGNPAGLRHSMTSGIVSGFRNYRGANLIQTDAPINPGNSGGPLVSSEGEVVGVNTMILSNTEGIGFALPMSSVLDEFRNDITP